MQQQFNPTKITISNGGDRNMTLSVPWGSTLEDWKTVFKTILIFETFTESQVFEFFEQNENNQYEN
jgi:hypothetical protein